MEINIQYVEKFVASLDTKVIAKVIRIIDLLEKFGPSLRLPYSKPLVKGLFELRISGQQEIRLIYCFHDNKIYFLTGFIKKTQKTPLSELEKARQRYKLLTQYNL